MEYVDEITENSLYTGSDITSDVFFSVVYKGLNANCCSSMMLYSYD